MNTKYEYFFVVNSSHVNESQHMERSPPPPRLIKFGHRRTTVSNTVHMKPDDVIHSDQVKDTFVHESKTQMSTVKDGVENSRRSRRY